MVKEPIGLYIFRFVMGFGLFFFMAMLYWSSLLLEKDMQVLRSDITQLRGEIRSQKEDQRKWRNQARTQPSTASDNTSSSSSLFPLAKEPFALSSPNRPHIDDTFPNLLTADRFYDRTLPEILGEGFESQGVFRTSVLGKPENLHPFSNWSDVNTWRSLCIGAVGTLHTGIYEQFGPDMAIKVEARPDRKNGAVEYWVHLREGATWQPLEQRFFPSDLRLAPWFLKKHPVTAHDFKFFYDAMMNPYNGEKGAIALQTYYRDMEEIIVVDDLTFVVRWKPDSVEENGKRVPKLKYTSKMLTFTLNPLPSFVYKYFSDGSKILDDEKDPDTYRKNSVWAQNFTNHWAKNVIVSCGPWTFDGMTERQIAFRRNPDFYNPFKALVNRWEVQFIDTPDGIWQAFKAGQLSFQDLPVDKILELDSFLKSDDYAKQVAKGQAIDRLDYIENAYAYIGWNQARPYFANKKIRRALTMAIDRDRIIRKNLNGMAVETTGTFSRYSPAYDTSIEPWPFDPQAARQLLEEEGWVDTDGDGIREKLIDGKRVPFRFTMTYFVKSNNAKAIGDYIATALREIGVEIHPNGADIADISAKFDDKDFDALFMAWGLSMPPEDPRQLWYSSGAKIKGSSNAIGFVNQEADQIIDQLDYEYDPKRRIELYHRFDKIIHDEAPYTFLFVPKSIGLYRENLQNVFIPAERQELIPGANIGQPLPEIFWLRPLIGSNQVLRQEE